MLLGSATVLLPPKSMLLVMPVTVMADSVVVSVNTLAVPGP